MQTRARTHSGKQAKVKLISQTKNNPNNNLKTINYQTNRAWQAPMCVTHLQAYQSVMLNYGSLDSK